MDQLGGKLEIFHSGGHPKMDGSLRYDCGFEWTKVLGQARRVDSIVTRKNKNFLESQVTTCSCGGFANGGDSMGCFCARVMVVIAEGKQVTRREEAEDGSVADGDEEVR